MSIKNIAKVALLSVSIISSHASDNQKNDTFPSWSIAPTVEQVQEAYDMAPNYYHLPSITVDGRVFSTAGTQVPLYGPFTVEKASFGFDGTLRYVYNGSKGYVTYETKVLNEELLLSYRVFGYSTEEKREYLQKRLIRIKDNVLRWCDILRLASGQRVCLGEEIHAGRGYSIRAELPELDDSYFVNIELTPLNENEFAKLKSLANFALQDNSNLPKFFYPFAFHSPDNQCTIINYEFNIGDVRDINLKAQ